MRGSSKLNLIYTAKGYSSRSSAGKLAMAVHINTTYSTDAEDDVNARIRRDVLISLCSVACILTPQVS